MEYFEGFENLGNSREHNSKDPKRDFKIDLRNALQINKITLKKLYNKYILRLVACKDKKCIEDFFKTLTSKSKKEEFLAALFYINRFHNEHFIIEFGESQGKIKDFMKEFKKFLKHEDVADIFFNIKSQINQLEIPNLDYYLMDLQAEFMEVLLSGKDVRDFAIRRLEQDVQNVEGSFVYKILEFLKKQEYNIVYRLQHPLTYIVEFYVNVYTNIVVSFVGEDKDIKHLCSLLENIIENQLKSNVGKIIKDFLKKGNIGYFWNSSLIKEIQKSIKEIYNIEYSKDKYYEFLVELLINFYWYVSTRTKELGAFSGWYIRDFFEIFYEKSDKDAGYSHLENNKSDIPEYVENFQIRIPMDFKLDYNIKEMGVEGEIWEVPLLEKLAQYSILFSAMEQIAKDLNNLEENRIRLSNMMKYVLINMLFVLFEYLEFFGMYEGAANLGKGEKIRYINGLADVIAVSYILDHRFFDKFNQNSEKIKFNELLQSLAKKGEKGFHRKENRFFKFFLDEKLNVEDHIERFTKELLDSAKGEDLNINDVMYKLYEEAFYLFECGKYAYY